MTAIRRLAFLALGVAFAHIVFGAIVRISGSGLGCGDHWPKCYGYWLPPISRADLLIEVTHRYLAAVLLLALGALAVTAWRKRAELGVPGRGGVLRSALVAAELCVASALFGAVTVRLANAPFATVGHWLLATMLLAVLAATLVLTGSLGSARVLTERVTGKTVRAAYAATGLALAAVTLGGLTAKIPGASLGCQGFPLCSGTLVPSGGPQHVHMTHRVIAMLLLLHLLGLAMAVTKRREPPVIVRASRIALGLVALQIVVAVAMVELHLPGILRSLHQAVGASIWLSIFVMTYLARIGAGASPLTAAGRDAAGPRVLVGAAPASGVPRIVARGAEP